MDIGQVTAELRRRLAAPLPEFYERRLIFWYDEDREFEEDMEAVESALAAAGARLLRRTGRNDFALKRILSDEDHTSFVIYDPCPRPKPDEDWLMDARLYGESFQADLLSSWMEEIGLDPTGRAREAVKQYRKFFQAKERRAKLARVRGDMTGPRSLVLAMMAALAGAGQAEAAPLFQAVLSRGLDEERNPVYAAFQSYGLIPAFWELAQRHYGYKEEAPTLSHLAAHLFLTALSCVVRPDLLEGLSPYIAVPYGTYCHDFIDQWIQSGERKMLYQTARYVEGETELPAVLARLAPSDIAAASCFPCVHEVLLSAFLRGAASSALDRDLFASVWERRRLFPWYDDYRLYYEALGGICAMEEFYASHGEGFHETVPEALWERYLSDYYRMDQAYRRYRLAYQEGMTHRYEALDEELKKAGEAAERLYTNWYLQELLAAWDRAAGPDLSAYGFVRGLPRQEDFYRDHAAGADSRIFVIISDAMRYEVAAELAEKLRRQTQCEARLSAMEGIFPTATKFGMAALLPHKELSAEVRNGTLAILADGMGTDSLSREAVLRRACAASTAFRASDYIGKKRADRAAMVKGMDVVYIYHDRIDEASHSSDADVFRACRDTIEELTSLVRMVVNDSGAAHIFITADHGFLYQAAALQEADKTVAAGRDAVEQARRYVITKKGVSLPGLLPVAFLGGKTDFDAWGPAGTTRLKMRGGGLQFVHGGASLQELAVPLIDYRYLRNDSSEVQRHQEKYAVHPVPLLLLSASRRVGSRAVSLDFYQKEPVGENRRAAVYLIYFTDSHGKAVSDVQKILADKTDPLEQNRIWRCPIRLKPGAYAPEEPYYLVIENEKTRERTEEEFQILVGKDWME